MEEMQNMPIEEIDIQLAENQQIEEDINESHPTSEEKRDLLKRTKIVKQTWSIQEIYQKIRSGRLVLSPDYQRNEIWPNDKKTAFIESLYMGIIIPPIYVVEIPGADLLSDSIYEVVDGKQRLTTIEKFLAKGFALSKKSLEYYKDWFGGKTYYDIQEQYPVETLEMLSSVLDIYVITANSPEFTKYDIFSRLNKGAEKLKVNEIRKAIYRSPLLEWIDEYVKSYTDTGNEARKQKYKRVFSPNDIKRYEDYGRFYTSIAFKLRSDIETGVVIGYNSRPRDMINNVLQEIQNNKLSLSKENIIAVLDFTMSVLEQYRNTEGIDYIINSCVPYIDTNLVKIYEKLPDIISDRTIKDTFEKSPATTSSVNNRLLRVKEILNE
ncbi:MAG: DUF262 domain-containing protein [Bacteroidales bacterium]|nr:DUF262 domain-containing protein [Bacteroidales bacterium]